MKMRIKLLAAVGAAAAVMMPAANAGASVGGVTGNFAGVVSTSVSPLPVRCQPGSTSGTSTGTLNLSLTSDTSGAGSVGNLANANKVKASWPGGSLWLNRFGRTYKSSKNAKFPCPSTDTAPMTVVFQPYQGGRKVGSAAQVQTTVSWSGRRVVRQFAAVSSVGQIDLNCRANTKAKSLTTIKLEATRNTAGIDASLLGDNLNRATSLRATWNGGLAGLGRRRRFLPVVSAARFPLPHPT